MLYEILDKHSAGDIFGKYRGLITSLKSADLSANNPGVEVISVDIHNDLWSIS